jgi:hypothetical protein
MKQAIRVALLCVVIGFALGYLGLSIHSILAEANVAPKVQVQAAKPSPFHIYIGGKLSAKKPKAVHPLPPPMACGVSETDPCRLREVRFI